MARLVERTPVTGKPCVPKVETPLPRERRSGPAYAGGKHAIEHVDAPLDHVEDPRRIADAHEVARPVRGEQRRCPLDGVEPRLALLADEQTAERVPVEPELRDLLDGTSPELDVDASLGDAEEELAVGAGRGDLALAPMLSSG